MYNIIVTSGGTEEKIDEVRKITNNATGKLGSIIAEKLLQNKNVKVFYVCSKTAIRPEKVLNLEIIETEGVYGLKEAIENLLLDNQIDFFIHTMAVSDYMVDYVSTSQMLAEYISQNSDIHKDNIEKINIEKSIIENENRIDASKKISSSEENLIIKLKKAPKVISCIKEISPETKLIGFKLLNQVTEEELVRISQNLLKKNRCELVIGNDSKSFVNGRHEAIFVTQNGIIDRAETKEEIADKIVKFLDLK